MNNRRNFIASGIAASVCSTSFAHAPSVLSKIQVGLIGCGVRGKYLLANLPQDVQVTAICDCSLDQVDSVLNPSTNFKDLLAGFLNRNAPSLRVFQDYREMLDRLHLDGVIIAAPDHHHVQAAIQACRNGIDVYCEKPLTLTVAEGRQLSNAVSKYDRVLQVGSQQRTMEVNRFACEWIRDGGLGKVHRVQMRNLPGPANLPLDLTEVQPKTMDWNLFCGPTPLIPYHRNFWMKDAYSRDGRLWRGWDLYRNFSGHLMTNWGGHSVDMLQFALGQHASGPIQFRLQPEKLDEELMVHWNAKTPPDMRGLSLEESLLRFCPVQFEYASSNDICDGTLVELDPKAERLVFHGERGKVFLSRNKYSSEPRDLMPKMDSEAAKRWQGAGHVAKPHLQNWLDCIQTRAVPNAPVEAGHRCATICHLVNIARRIRRDINWDPVMEKILGDQSANELLDRPRRTGFQLPE